MITLQQIKKGKDKYGVVLLFSLMLLVAVYICALSGEKSKNLWDYAVEKGQWEQIAEQRRASQTLLQDTKGGLMISGYELPYVKEENRFYLSVCMDDSEEWHFPDGLDFYGELDGFAVCRDEYLTGEIDGIENDSIEKEKNEKDRIEKLKNAIREGHEFRVVFYTGEVYQQAGLVLTGLPVVAITTSREEPREYPIEEIDDYVYNSETRYYGNVTIFQAAKPYQILKRGICYHERGQTSSVFSKKSYALKLLDEQEQGVSTSLFGMESSEKWKLNAMYSDVSKIRDKTSLEIWKEIAGQDYEFDESGAEMEYCEVILDGEYLGLYGMMLPINEDTLGLGGEDVLYKILDWEMPSAEDIQASVEQNYEVCYPIRIRYPEDFVTVESLWEPMKIYLSAKYWAPDMGLYADMTYPDNLADYLIYIQAVAGYDNYLKNTYVAATPAGNVSGYKMVTIPWDMNFTFGDCYAYDPEHNYLQFNADTSVNYVEPVLEDYFRQNVGGSAELLKRKWQSYRKDILSEEHIIRIMQENRNVLVQSGAFERESQKWPEVDNETDLTMLEDYVRERLNYLDGYFAQF